MIWILGVSLVTPILIGYLLVCLLWPGRPLDDRVLKASLAVGIGYGCTSCVFFLLILAGTPSWASFIIELLVGIGLFFALRRQRAGAPGRSMSEPVAGLRFEPLLRAAFWGALALAFVAFVVLSLRHPHGGDAENTDAWGNWNLRARLIHRMGAQWPAAFSAPQGRLYTGNPDYPLLLPLTVARSWNFVGTETTIVPAAVAFLFTFATVGLIWSSLSALRGPTQSDLGSLALLGLPAFITIGAWQYADMPLALLYSSTSALLLFHDRSPREERGLLILAGLSTGLAAWTKNEGWLFLIALFIGRWFVVGVRRGLAPYLRQQLLFSTGLVPVLAIVIFFKWHFAATNDLMMLGIRSGLLFARVRDLSRPFVIVSVTLEQLLRSTGWIASLWALIPYAFLAGTKVDTKDRTGVTSVILCFGLLLAAYFCVYVVTPVDLEWHVKTSVLRLLLHVWPSAVLAYFMVIAVGSSQRPVSVRSALRPTQ